jgi:hypothetical protein
VMADIVMQQTMCAKILVGDPHQAGCSTFHVIQSRTRVMGWHGSRHFAVKTPICDNQSGPCNPSDTREQQPCHREIYSFMGAKNAMAAVAAALPRRLILERRLVLSFRFGYEIAAVANSLLRLKGEAACVLGARRETTTQAPQKNSITPHSKGQDHHHQEDHQEEERVLGGAVQAESS